MRKKIGEIGVDAGLCWIGDPCYIHKDGEESVPKEWGKNWGEFLESLEEKQKGDFGQPVQFNYDLGHSGLGVCTPTGLGDGTYPVYATIEEVPGSGKRIKKIEVIFIDDNDKHCYEDGFEVALACPPQTHHTFS